MNSSRGNLADRIIGITEAKSQPIDLVKALFAEFLGTLILVLLACGSCVQWIATPDLVQISLAFGIIVATIVQCIGHVSGGHINPAVTAGMLVTGKITVLRGFLYIIVQCLGGITGAGILKGLTPDSLHEHGLGDTEFKNLETMQALGVEYFITFVLVLTVFAVCDPNRTDVKGSAPLAIGLAVATGHLFAIKYTGAGMNPARSFGPAVFSGKWEHHWVYWIGPMVGGMTAGILYNTLFAAKPVDFEKDNVQFMQLKTHDGDKEGASKGLMPVDAC